MRGSMRRLPYGLSLVVTTALFVAGAAAQPVFTVGPGEDAQYRSIQAAIDAAPEGAVVRIGPGEYDGGVSITKPLTLEGAGRERTTIVAAQPRAEAVARLQRDVEQLARQGRGAANPAQFQAMFRALREKLDQPTVRVEGVRDVRIRGLKIAAQPISTRDGGFQGVLVRITNAKASITDCVITGSPGNGVEIRNGSDVEVRNSLVCGLWGNGIEVGINDRSDQRPEANVPCRLVLADSDVRNCYHVGVYIDYTADVTVERCRVSGSAWHGIRYGGGPQKILASRIFNNARCGIYADGDPAVAATVRGNVFARSEGVGIVLFSGAADVVGNTFADNVSSGISVLGKAKVTAEKNLFVNNEAGVWCGTVNGQPEPRPVGEAKLRDNVFWWNKDTVALSKWDRDGGREPPEWAKLDEAAGNVVREVKFADADLYTLPADAPERRAGVGAAEPLPAQSPFPLQPQEQAIVPDGPGRDYNLWKRPALEPLRVVELPDVPGALAVDKATYADAFKDLYEVLGREYPCFELKKIDWKAVGDELLPRAKQVDNEKDFGLFCMELVARLQDSHALVGPGAAQPPVPEYPMFDPGFACLIGDEDQPVIYHVDRDGPADRAGVRPGMTVLSVDGKPAAAVLAERMKQLSKYAGYSSDRYLRYHAAQFLPRVMLQGQDVKLELEDVDGKTLELKLPASMRSRYIPRLPVAIPGVRDTANVSWTMLNDRIGYVYVRRINNDLIEQLDRAVGELQKAKALVIDVRGNSGGGFDAERSFRNFSPDDPAEPGRPRFAGPIAMLIDPRCISAGEGWSSWFVANRRARFFGEATAGASSRKRQHVLKNGLYTVTFPVKAYAGFLDRPIERRGLEPDVPVRQSAVDLAAGRDTVLEAARAYLEGEIK